MVLSGSLVKLRPFREDDYHQTFIWRSDSELRKLAQFHFFPITESLEKEWLESILQSKSDKTISLAIEEKKENTLIGYFKLNNINWVSRTALLGILIGAKDARGKGYGKETMQLGLHYAFQILNLRKISLEVLECNNAAVALYKKNGFKEEGLMKEHFFFEGKYYDVKIMGIFNK
jgi:[ribosomal protein S5]-alanine N-acetyltransferase